MTCPCGLTWLEFKLWDRRALLQGSRWNIEIAAVALCSLPGFPRHSLSLTLVCQSKWRTANTERTKTRSAESVCFSRFGGEGGWVTPRRSETQRFTWSDILQFIYWWNRVEETLSGWEFRCWSCCQPYLLTGGNKISALFVLFLFNNRSLRNICNLKCLACLILLYSFIFWPGVFYYILFYSSMMYSISLISSSVFLSSLVFIFLVQSAVLCYFLFYSCLMYFILLFSTLVWCPESCFRVI